MMNRASVEAAIHSILSSPVKPWVSTEVVNQLFDNLRKIGGSVGGVGVEEDAIRTSKTFSREGQQQQLQALADRSAPKLSYYGQEIRDNGILIAKLTANMIG